MVLDPNQLDTAVRAADLAAGNAPLSDAGLAGQLSTPVVTLRCR